MSTTAKILLIASIVLTVLCAVVCGGGAVWLYVSSMGEFEPPENIAVVITAPDEVKPGETFTVEVRVLNEADRAQTLDSIDVHDTYTAGFRLRSSTPAWRSSSRADGYISFDYQIKIPARGEHVVRFEATALRRGDYEGDWDICINSPWSFVSEVVRTIVDDEAEAPATSGERN